MSFGAGLVAPSRVRELYNLSPLTMGGLPLHVLKC